MVAIEVRMYLSLLLVKDFNMYQCQVILTSYHGNYCPLSQLLQTNPALTSGEDPGMPLKIMYVLEKTPLIRSLLLLLLLQVFNFLYDFTDESMTLTEEDMVKPPLQAKRLKDNLQRFGNK
jgi:hypothetical protein